MTRSWTITTLHTWATPRSGRLVCVCVCLSVCLSACPSVFRALRPAHAGFALLVCLVCFFFLFRSRGMVYFFVCALPASVWLRSWSSQTRPVSSPKTRCGMQSRAEVLKVLNVRAHTHSLTNHSNSLTHSLTLSCMCALPSIFPLRFLSFFCSRCRCSS